MRYLAIALAAFLLLVPACGSGERPLRVASKKFTESVVLGESLRLLAVSQGEACEHEKEMGGTRIVFDALVNGEIDAYVEYTGTLQQDILAQIGRRSLAGIREALEERGVRMGPTLGFNNTYDLAMRREKAESLGIESISDLREHPDLRFGFTHEFLERDDGWLPLKQRYGLPQKDPKGLDHDLAYEAIGEGEIDLKEVYSTDAEIAIRDLVVLRDDRDFFPAYEAVVLYRAELEETHPHVVAAFERLRDQISEAEMLAMNFAVDGEGQGDGQVASAYLQADLGIYVATEEETRLQRYLKRTREHLVLVGVSLLISVFVGLGLGVLAARTGAFGQGLIGVVGAAQTIPGLALLALLVPWLGIGWKPTIFALVVYSLLPIVRNTHAGIVGIPRAMQESAEVLGLSPATRLFSVELPLAAPSILAGIKTAAVWNVGLATIGALIGAGGYGQLILSGIRRNDTALLLEGAVSSIVLALLLQFAFEVLERKAVSRGLRPARG